MPDLETRLPELLQDLSTDIPADGGGSAPVLRKARRRRALTAATTAVTVVAVIAGGVVGARSLAPTGRSSIGSTQSPTVSVAPPAVTPIGAVWPETTADGLAFAQQQVDDGHQPWRTDPIMTAEAFAVNVFGWAPGDVRSTVLPGPVDAVIVSVANGPRAPEAIVTLQRIGERGENGVWSVIRADTPLLTATVEDGPDGTPAVRVRISQGASVEISHEIYTGPTLESPVTSGVVSDGSSIPLPAESPTGAVVVVVSASTGGQTVGADVLSVPTSMAPTAGPSAVPTVEPLPATVARTRDAILRGVETRDIPALAGLIDPNTFAYNFDDGSDPIPAWKEDPSVLDPIPGILALPPTEPKHIEGYGTFYVWPYLMDSDMANLSPSEVDDLHALGFDDAAIDRMRRFGSYIGPRLAIDEHGLWRNYVTGGD
jgi:hypothetical protein